VGATVNAALWFLGRLQTDADRARVLDGLLGSEGTQDLSAAELARTIQRLAQRWFAVRNAHVPASPSCSSRPTPCRGCADR